MWCSHTLNRLSLPAVLLVLCLSPVDALAQIEVEPTHKFELEEVLSIGDDEEAPREYLFTNPEYIRTDADGRIYVVEGRGIGTGPGTEVRVFSPDGEFLGALGRHGGGPGEFKDIQAIAIDTKDRLVVYDRRPDRFTRYPPFETIESFPRPDPDRIETVPNPQEHRITPGFMHGLPNGHFMLYYHPPEGRRAPDQPRLYAYDENFDKIEAFGIPSEWNLPNGEVTQYFIRSGIPSLLRNGHVTPGTSTLVVAPTLYQGLLYRYVPSEQGSWLLQRLEGRAPGHPTHEVVKSSDQPFSFISSEDIGARYRSASHGVGQLSDGRVVHLSTSEDENGIRQLQLELFSPDGTLQKVGRIERFVHDITEGFEAVEQAVSVQLLWVDRKNRLYLEDHRSGFPVIRVMKLEE